jgi:hypothetical protein
MLAGVLLTDLMAKSPVSWRETIGRPIGPRGPKPRPSPEPGRVWFGHGCHEGSSRIRDRCHGAGRHGGSLQLP